MKKKTRKEPRAEEPASEGKVVEAAAAVDGKLSKKERKALKRAAAAAAEQDGDEKGEKKEKTLPRKWASTEGLEHNKQRELEQRNCTKYHYLKFIEKQKVERKLTKVRLRLENATAAGEKETAKVLRKALRSHLADYEYVNHYPKHLPYNALFPIEDSEKSQKRRAQVRKMIAESLGQDTEAKGEAGHEHDEKEGQTEETPSRGQTRAGQAITGLANGPAKKEDRGKKKDYSLGDPDAKKRRKKEQARRKRDLKRKMGKVDHEATSKGKVAETSAPAEQKSKKVKAKDSAEAGVVGEHPSWQASKSAKVSGSLVEGAGERKTFESESESDS